MLEPMLWNKLSEAAAWLSQTTGEAWTVNHVLNAAITHLKPRHRSRPPITYLKAATPRNTAFGVYEINKGQDSLKTPFLRKFAARWRTVPLALLHVQELLVHGETSIDLALSPDDEDGMENEYIFIEPFGERFIVQLEMVGITGRDLKSLSSNFEPRTETILNSLEQEQDELIYSAAKQLQLPPPGYNRKKWTNERLTALVDESRQPGVTQSKLAARYKISRQWIGALLEKARELTKIKIQSDISQFTASGGVRKIKGKPTNSCLALLLKYICKPRQFRRVFLPCSFLASTSDKFLSYIQYGSRRNLPCLNKAKER